ncbi:putative caffeine resistance protein 5 [Aureobasidium pullulans]|uniref:Caffeine resistance protein 5 n=1 Tax=Aureobasidium pullulans TaxID=5580 RepID=A0A4S9WGX6_AURPU|nr:putative caffeine resistance protein 5 [Aureobasidium pullulans]THZ64559.1 putative caffeine resistance protein 5 [Aureobasidium pullulans]
MSDLFRDAPVGQMIRWMTKNKYLQYPEEKDTSMYGKFINREKSGDMARYGQPNPPEDEEKEEKQDDNQDRSRHNSESSDPTLRGEGTTMNSASGIAVDPEKGKDVNLVDWWGPNDPECPTNWSQGKKFFVTFLICLLTTSIYIGSSIYSAGEQQITMVFGVSTVVATIGLTLFVAGGISAICGPVLGPLVGGFAAQHEDWTWPIWELVWLSGFCWVVLMFCLPETSGNNLLVRRTKRLRKLTGNQNLRCVAELMREGMSTKDIAIMSLVRPFTLNLTEGIVFALNLYIALIYGLLYVWFESFVIVFIDIYGFNLGEEGLAYLGILIGAFAILPPFFLYLYKILEPQFDDKGDLKPEKRLPPACVGAFMIPICLFWFGWSARADIHWIMPIIGSAFFSMESVLLFNSVLNYLPDAYPEYAASVLAGNDFMRSAFGAGFPLFARAMYNDLGVNWASSTLGFLAIAFVPIPFALHFYGETLREKYSKHARKDIQIDDDVTWM